jgi:hypothetical protein
LIVFTWIVDRFQNHQICLDAGLSLWISFCSTPTAPQIRELLSQQKYCDVFGTLTDSSPLSSGTRPNRIVKKFILFVANVTFDSGGSKAQNPIW